MNNKHKPEAMAGTMVLQKQKKSPDIFLTLSKEIIIVPRKQYYGLAYNQWSQKKLTIEYRISFDSAMANCADGAYL